MFQVNRDAGKGNIEIWGQACASAPLFGKSSLETVPIGPSVGGEKQEEVALLGVYLEREEGFHIGWGM